ncbi:MAG TPA: 50S ribosomal protein L25/general stress protein Ctc [Desulfosalsimonadaceae bacterium]|nr:50S ribosomal protein L25/general stress protein Ctc [Desulfosalsimonadaceae bacterium]
MDRHQITAKRREKTGKGTARTLRQQGNMPAVLYGASIDSMPLSVNIHDMEVLLNKVSPSQALLDLQIENGARDKKTVMIKELQIDPVKFKYLHIDFYEVKMDQQITTTVPVVTTGTSKGVEEGGIVQIIRRELEVSCLPGDIPEQVEIDITDLDVGDSVHVEDIDLGEKIEIPYDTNFTILTIVSPAMELEEEPEAEELEEGEEGEGGVEGEAEAGGEVEEE